MNRLLTPKEMSKSLTASINKAIESVPLEHREEAFYEVVNYLSTTVGGFPEYSVEYS